VESRAPRNRAAGALGIRPLRPAGARSSCAGIRAARCVPAPLSPVAPRGPLPAKVRRSSCRWSARSNEIAVLGSDLPGDPPDGSGAISLPSITTGDGIGSPRAGRRGPASLRRSHPGSSRAAARPRYAENFPYWPVRRPSARLASASASDAPESTRAAFELRGGARAGRPLPSTEKKTQESAYPTPGPACWAIRFEAEADAALPGS